MSNIAEKLPFTPDAVVFDCDSTLVSIEGIDELAKFFGKENEVARLTNMAMNGEIPLEEVYEKRLKMIAPTRNAIEHQLADLYLETVNDGARKLCERLDVLGIKRALVTGGLYDAVKPLADSLRFPPDSFFAVHLDYDGDNFLRVVDSPLTTANGKAQIVASWKNDNKINKIVMIGDGGSDLATLGNADAMIGYGYYVTRPNVVAGATLFSTAPSLYDLLPLLNLDHAG